MTQALAEIIQAVEKLSRKEKAELTDILVESSHSEIPPEREAEILAEVRRRAEGVDSGRVQTIPIEKVFAEMHELLNRPE